MDLAALTDTAKGDEPTLRLRVGAGDPGALTQLLLSEKRGRSRPRLQRGAHSQS
ncbi:MULTISPECIES: hypothetical protein [Streptomyces]|uniref:hypothetical protein n=1 Tax=Streptomyces TaxID=1883 RepID=UPI0036A77C57